MRASRAVNEAHAKVNRAIHSGRGNAGAAFRNALHEALRELVPRMLAVYAELDEAAQTAGRDELVSNITQRVRAFIQSSVASVRGSSSAGAAREGANLIAKWSAAIPHEFDLAIYDARKSARSTRDEANAGGAQERQYSILLDLMLPLARLQARSKIYIDLLGDDGGLEARLMRASHREHFQTAISELHDLWSRSEVGVFDAGVRKAFAAQRLVGLAGQLKQLADGDHSAWDDAVREIGEQSEALAAALRAAIEDHQRVTRTDAESANSDVAKPDVGSRTHDEEDPTAATRQPPPPPPTSRSRCDLLLVVVTDTEHSALIEAWRAVTGGRRAPSIIHGDKRSYDDLGVVAGTHVAVVQTQMGTSTVGGSLSTIHTAIRELQPRNVLMVGIAFGVSPEKQPIGTVLVAERVHQYEMQRVGVKSDGSAFTIRRGDRAAASADVLSRLKIANRDAPAKFGLLLSGEKLVDNHDYREALRDAEPEALGGEMEGGGLYVAATEERVGWCVVKAVCDWADGNKGADKDSRQRLAARNAADYVMRAVAAGGFAAREPSTMGPRTGVPKGLLVAVGSIVIVGVVIVAWLIVAAKKQNAVGALQRHGEVPQRSGPALSDGQRGVLAKKLMVPAGTRIRIVRIGNAADTGVMFEQLRDLFIQTNWTVDAVSIGTPGVVGTAFPSTSYMTSTDIANPLVRSVFLAFSEVGVDLPLVPDAFAGPQLGPAAPVVVVLH